MAVLTRASRAGSGADIENALLNVVTRIQKTIVDVHAIFGPKSGGSCMLADLVHPSYSKKSTLKLTARGARKLCTTWLSVLAPKISAFSKDLLSRVTDTNTLARIRGILWKITHEACTGASPVPVVQPVYRDWASDETVWAEAASFAIDASSLVGSVNPRGTVASPAQLDLWSLLFSRIFANLAEDLLKESLVSIQQDVQHRLDSILLAITGNHTDIQHGRPSFSINGGQQVHALTSHDILAAADSVVSFLSSELRSLSGDAWCLTERGDKIAADALNTSFYLLCVEMAVSLVNHLRIALQKIRTCIKSAISPDRQGHNYDDNTRELEDAVGSFADAGLVVGRVAWLLRGRSGRPLHSALTPPPSFTQKVRGRIEEQQLEAAFVIADTNGNGVVDAEEAAEALQAVSFGSSMALVLDPSPFSSLTLSEFSLFATRLLEEQRPQEHLNTCLDDLLTKSLTTWVEWALQETAALLGNGCTSLAALCCNTGVTDDIWRKSHGIWEDKMIELDRDDGDEIQESVHFPVMVSPAILCYIAGVAAELSRILSTADLLEATPADRPDNRTETARKVDMGAGHAARYARSLAAARAARELKQAMTNLCEGPHAPAVQACEAAQVQLLLDAMFLQEWIPGPEGATSSMRSIVLTLSELVDPINLQIYMPHLEAAASACSTTCHTWLSLIFERKVVNRGPSVSISPDGMLGSSSTFVPLVPKTRRFEILPLPLDVVRMQHPNGLSAVRTLPGNKPGTRVGNGAGVSSQARGMEAGRQALADLMGQVGSVGSVLSAQNVNVQSVFGAASLFLGGRNRRTDMDEDAMLSSVL